MVPSYTGSSTYLLMTKYNNYCGSGSATGKMKSPFSIPTPPSTIRLFKHAGHEGSARPPWSNSRSGLSGGYKEWCINTAAVDPFTKSVMANSEDGSLYRWDMTSNTFTQVIKLSTGIGEAYTPTVIGADGTVYAINDAMLDAVGDGKVVQVSGGTDS